MGELQDDLDLAALVARRRARRRRRPRHHFVLVAFAVSLFVIVASLAGAALTGRALVFGACDLKSLRPVALGSSNILVGAGQDAFVVTFGDYLGGVTGGRDAVGLLVGGTLTRRQEPPPPPVGVTATGQAVEPLPNQSVAFAARGFEAVAIEHRHLAAVVGDETRVL